MSFVLGVLKAVVEGKITLEQGTNVIRGSGQQIIDTTKAQAYTSLQNEEEVLVNNQEASDDPTTES